MENSATTAKRFSLPASLPWNATAWGPDLSLIPKKFLEIPYAPFSKADKLGRVADWYAADAAEKQQQEEGTRRRRFNDRQSAALQDISYGAGVQTAFSYVHAEDDSSFLLVDRQGGVNPAAVAAVTAGLRGNASSSQVNAQAAPSAWGSRGRPGSSAQSASKTNQRNDTRNAAAGRNTGTGKNAGSWSTKPPARRLEPSIIVGSDWPLLDEYPLSAFNKLYSDNVTAKECDVDFGTLPVYDKNIDRLMTRLEKRLAPVNLVDSIPTVAQDPLMKKAKESLVLPNGEKVEGDLVLATDQIMATLMMAPRSLQSWDIIVTRSTLNGHRIVVFDKRPDSVLDAIPVQETANEQLADMNGDPDNVNSPGPMSREFSLARRKFRQAAVRPNQTHDLGKPDPFNDANRMKKGYRYRLWEFSTENSEGNVTLLARTHLDAMTTGTGNKLMSLTVQTLQETYPLDLQTGLLQANYVDWRHRLDGQRGAILATEIRNNANKIARLTMEAVLSNADQMKVGFLSRTVPLNPTRGHSALAVHTLRPLDFGQQLNIDHSQAWGILKSLVNVFLNQEDGQFVLLKDPAGPKVKLYQVGPSGLQGPVKETAQ